MMLRSGAMRHRSRRPGNRDEGAAAVEFALVLPILVTLLLGIIQFGWYFFVANNASSAAREGARRVVVGECWNSSLLTFVQGQAPTVTSATHSTLSASSTVGESVTITVKADGAIISFIPWGASGGEVTRTFTARLEDTSPGDGTCS